MGSWVSQRVAELWAAARATVPASQHFPLTGILIKSNASEYKIYGEEDKHPLEVTWDFATQEAQREAGESISHRPRVPGHQAHWTRLCALLRRLRKCLESL